VVYLNIPPEHHKLVSPETFQVIETDLRDLTEIYGKSLCHHWKPLILARKFVLRPLETGINSRFGGMFQKEVAQRICE
jgi:hypothetical protein